MPNRFSSWQRPTCPPASAFHCGRTTHGAPAPALDAIGKVARADDVVFRMRRGDRAREREAVAVEHVVVARRQREKGVALFDACATPTPRAARTSFSEPGLETFNPVEPPFERPDEAVLGPRRQPPLPVVKDPAKSRCAVSSRCEPRRPINVVACGPCVRRAACPPASRRPSGPPAAKSRDGR